MRTMLHSMVFIFLLSVCVDAQTVVVTRNANLRSDASIDRAPITKLTPGTQLQLNEPEPIRGFYHVQTADRTIGFVWARTVRSQSAHASPASVSAQGFPAPLLAKQHPVDWWFVFKFNSATFPGCGMTTRTCLFGGDVQTYRNFSQQFVYAS